MIIRNNNYIEQSGVTEPYVHTQSISSSSWTVNHGFGYKPAAITVERNDQLLLTDVDHVDLNSFTVSFNFSTTGIVRCR